MTPPLEERLRRVSNDGREGADAPPERVYAFYSDGTRAPATYMEVAEESGGPVTPVVVHNLRYYEQAMREWESTFVEVLVLNELHELAHWAMTDEERARLDARSQRTGLPDGYWLNPELFRIIDWLGAERGYPQVVERDPPLWRRIGASVRAWVARLVGAGDGGTESDPSVASGEAGEGDPSRQD